MIKYAALLRGINVGGNKKVEMSKLKKTFESLGFSDVSTYINSGNVIFSSSKKVSVEIIEKALAKTFGFDIKTIVRDYKNIKKVYQAIPADWENDTEQRTDILFLWPEFDSKKTLDLIKTNSKVDSLIYVPGAIIWNLKRKNYNKSGLHDFIGTIVYKNMTTRNVNTVRKIYDILVS